MDTSKHIFNIHSDKEFNAISLQIFNLQYNNNPVYHQFCNLLQINPKEVKKIKQIPFLPIEFFKSHIVKTGSFKETATFLSSGTTGQTQSKHYVKDLSIYEKSFTKGFENQYGNITDYCVLALLPSYLEREGSSLVYMANHFIKESQHPLSGFYLNNVSDLIQTLNALIQKNEKVLLIGVSFALLDLAENHPLNLKNTIVMETGGMKGRKKEITRQDLHQILQKKFHVKTIHSEYGMTELLSQAYSKEGGIYTPPPWMKVLIRDINDPLHLLTKNKTGGVNIIDLANINSCSFIATQDLGKTHAHNTFEILGRFDNSDLRGCNLLIN